MATASVSSQPLALAPARTSSVLFLLRFEGLAMAAVSAALYARIGASWWLFAALFLAPDLSMLGYLAGACWGARVYNAIHTYVMPATLGLCALLSHAHLRWQSRSSGPTTSASTGCSATASSTQTASDIRTWAASEKAARDHAGSGLTSLRGRSACAISATPRAISSALGTA